MDILTTVLLISLVSFTVTFIIIPVYIKKAKENGISGIDKYKVEKKEVAESGGITILTGYIIALFLFVYFFPQFYLETFVVATSILLITMIGLIDDFFDISWRTKSLLPIFAAPPLIVITAGVTSMYIPFIGLFDFGIIYTFLFIPLAITGAANAVNMVAGYNGLETGLGIIMVSTLAVIGYITGNTIVLILSLPFLFTLLAFFCYNRYPAKIFPGDSGTFLIGITIAAIVIIGNLELVGTILFIPYFFNLILFILAYIHRGHKNMKNEKFGKVNEDGYLRVPHKYFLPWFVASFSDKMTEQRATNILFATELVFAVICISLFL